jgi:cytochrome P450 family 138
VTAPLVRISPRTLRKHHRRVFDDVAAHGELVWVDTGHQRFLVVNSADLVRELMVDRSEELVKPSSQAIETGPPARALADHGVPVAEFRAALAKGMGPGRIPDAVESATSAARAEVAQWRDGMRFRLMPRMRRLAITATCWSSFGSRLSQKDVFLAEQIVRRAGRRVPVNTRAAERWDRLTLGRWRRRGSVAHLALLSRILVANADRSRPTQLTAVLDDLPRLAPSWTEFDRQTMLVELFRGAVGPLAQTCGWTLVRFASEPEAAAHLRAEWDGENRTYTEAFVREVTRLHPTNERITRQAVAETALGGEHVPELTRIVLNVGALHGDPRSFEEPGRFAPERWLDGRPTPNKFAYVAFGLGGRRCLGEAMAVASVTAMLPALLRDWDIRFGKLRVATKGRHQPAESVKATVRTLDQRPPDRRGELAD